jgi:arginine-tRNA-protein transferase
MGTISVKFLMSESAPCGYYDDGRMASHDYYGLTIPTQGAFEKKVLESMRKTRFSLMRKGLIGDIFSAKANDCPTCNACVPLRINTLEFNLSSRQKRILKKFENSNGEVIWTEPENFLDLIAKFYELYKKYLNARFPHSPMSQHDIEDLYISMMSKSDLMVITDNNNTLLGFTQVDREGPEASLDYIVYDPDASDLFLGGVSFLHTVAWAQDNFIPYVYIGSTNETKALKYKRYYSGLETFDGEEWVAYDPKVHTKGPCYDTIISELRPDS